MTNPSPRYQIERSPKDDFESFDGEIVKVFTVIDSRLHPHHYRYWTRVDVSHGVPRCCKCQTALTGMSASCPHAQAVKRHLRKGLRANG